MLARFGFLGARSSAVEHCLDMAGVTGSIPVVPTTSSPDFSVKKSRIRERSRVQWRDEFAETNHRIVNLLRRVHLTGRFASFVRFRVCQIDRC